MFTPTVSGNQQPLLRLSWKGNTEISHDCITKWKVDFLSLFKGCKSAIMQKISAEIFHPLRLIIERIFLEYDAQLSAIIGGSLIFVFMHRDRQDADKMVEKKQEIHKIFQQLLGDIGNREVKFALSAERQETFTLFSVLYDRNVQHICVQKVSLDQYNIQL